MLIWRHNQRRILTGLCSNTRIFGYGIRNQSKIKAAFCHLFAVNKMASGNDVDTIRGPRGAFIVLEGCDRCGKTTQANLLVQNLKQRGHRVECMRFPDRTTKVGSLIGDYLMNKQELEDHVIHLLFSANRWEMRDKMLSLINNNTTLIVDRYSFSGVAFSSTKPNMDFDWCKKPEIGLPAPDAVIFLELDADVASRRGQFGNERYEDQNTQRHVREAYEKLRQGNWKIVDADRSIDQLQMEMLEIVENVIKSSREITMKQLWN